MAFPVLKSGRFSGSLLFFDFHSTPCLRLALENYSSESILDFLLFSGGALYRFLFLF